MGRFRLPGLTEIEYRNRNGGLNLLVSAWLTPSGDGQLRLFARIATARSWLPAMLKHCLLRKLFRRILHQDRQILERVSTNHMRFQTTPAKPLDGPQDLLGPSIRRLLEHGQPQVFEARQIDIWL